MIVTEWVVTETWCNESLLWKVYIWTEIWMIKGACWKGAYGASNSMCKGPDPEVNVVLF